MIWHSDVITQVAKNVGSTTIRQICRDQGQVTIDNPSEISHKLQKQHIFLSVDFAGDEYW